MGSETKVLMSVAQWRRAEDMAIAATPKCPHCDRHLGIRLGVWRDNGRDAWLCVKCGEWEAV
jgi:Zn ribbon nucleic-acid-binding protein